MARRALVIDLDRCSGCDTCVVACKFANGIPLGNYWCRVLAIGPLGTHPDVEMYWLPVQCQQCTNAPCIGVCPTGASFRSPENNVVLIDKEKCIGCQYCIYACPYGVRQYNHAEGVVEKCTLCNHLTVRSDGNENPDDSFDPAHAVPPCVHNCCTGARAFGDLDDPESGASKALATANPNDIYTLPDPGDIADPQTRYLLTPHTAQWVEIDKGKEEQ